MTESSVDPVDLARWISDNRVAIDAGTAGPVLDGELRVLVVIGRGPRLDYHVNTVAELFYQVEGDIAVGLREGDGVRTVTVRSGEVWVAPAGVPHAPQRPVGTIGLVVERARAAGSAESFRWYCDTCGAVVHEIVMDRVDPRELRAGVASFYDDPVARTCRACGMVVTPPGRSP
jgi:3-hydroxyanthranilate 3,4-dioxygenase